MSNLITHFLYIFEEVYDYPDLKAFSAKLKIDDNINNIRALEQYFPTLAKFPELFIFLNAEELVSLFNKEELYPEGFLIGLTEQQAFLLNHRD